MACGRCGCAEEGPRGVDEGEAGASESRGEGLGLRACHYLRHCGSVLERFADLLGLGGDELVFLGPCFHHPGCKVARGQQVAARACPLEASLRGVVLGGHVPTTAWPLGSAYLGVTAVPGGAHLKAGVDWKHCSSVCRHLP